MVAETAPRFEPIVHIDDAIWRQRVIDRITLAPPSTARLTLLTAPAGFGKTTLLAQLAKDRVGAGARLAWLNCNERDKAPALFTESLASALARSVPAGTASGPAGASLASLLGSTFGGLEGELLICIDEYERAACVEVDEIVEQLAALAPPQVRLFVASREAPPPHLTRSQLAGKVRLFDAELLRFTHDETTLLLKDVLSDRAVLQIAAYADGWPFALQLARLRAAGGVMTEWHIDARAKIPRRQIFDYLAAEVMATLPPPIIEFLGEVAVLDSVDVASANAVRNRDDSLGLVRQLGRLRPIVVVDESPWSARLHPLLRDYLLDAVETASPGRVAALHLRAAAHLAATGQCHEAVTHAVAGGRLDLGASIIEAAGAIRLLANEGALRSRLLLQQLPEATLRDRPRLRLLQLAEQVASTNPPGTAAEFERLEEQIRHGDSRADDPARLDLEFARCLILLNHGEHTWRFSPWSVLEQVNALAHAHASEDRRLLGFALPVELFFLHRYGPQERAERRTREIKAVHADGAYTYNSPWIWMYEARNALAHGDLAEAERLLGDSLQQDANFIRFRQDSVGQLAAVLLGRIAYLRGDMTKALEHFAAVLPQGPMALLEILIGGHVDLALCEAALGHAERATELLEQARHLAFEENFPHLEAAAGATQVELLARQGDLDGMRSLAEHIKLEDRWALAEEPFALPWPVVEAIARALFFVHLAERQGAAAMAVSEQFDQLARRVGRRVSQLAVQLMATLAHQLLGDSAAALRSLQTALAMASRFGVTQPFIEFGGEVIVLLRSVAARAPRPEQAAEHRNAQLILGMWEAAFRSHAMGAAANPLTPREIDVLGELAKDCSTKLIAKNLVLSPETVKHHLKAIFSKLAVRTRDGALIEARKRGLMP